MCCNCASTHRDPTVRPTGALYCRQASKQSTKGTTRKNAFITCSQKCGKLLSRDGAHNTSSIVLNISRLQRKVYCAILYHGTGTYSIRLAGLAAAQYFITYFRYLITTDQREKAKHKYGGEGRMACVRACVRA